MSQRSSHGGLDPEHRKLVRGDPVFRDPRGQGIAAWLPFQIVPASASHLEKGLVNEGMTDRANRAEISWVGLAIL